MLMPFQLSLNAVLVMVSGLIILIGGVFVGIETQYRILAGGLILAGFGTIMLGSTEGFTNPTPTGQFLFRVGATSYLLAAAILFLAFYGLMTTK